MAEKKTPPEVLDLAIIELKQINDLYNRCYDQLRTRILTVIAAGFALLSFLYTRTPGDFFIPEEDYGKILYAFGALLILSAFAVLFRALHSTTWYYPMNLKDLSKLNYGSRGEFLEELKSEYIETIKCNSLPYERKQFLFSVGLYSLIAGGTILMVINQLQK